jgi:hypothetical protein
MTLSRRGLFKTLLGATVATVAAPLIPVVQKVLPHRQLPTILLPMIRRTMPTLIAADIIGIQPMNAPTGQVFAMKLIDTTRRPTSFLFRVLTGRKYKS